MVPESIPTSPPPPPPMEGHQNFLGEGVIEAKPLEEKYEAGISWRVRFNFWNLVLEEMSKNPI